MRSVFFFLLVFILTVSCQESETQAPEQVYMLHRANFNPTYGRVTIRDLGDDQLEFLIELENTDPSGEHPAHLHFGGIDEVGELAYALNPVEGETGISRTVLENVKLDNGELLTFDMLSEMNGSVKVHMNGDLFKHIVLASGNIGKNEDYLFDGVAVCVGH